MTLLSQVACSVGSTSLSSGSGSCTWRLWQSRCSSCQHSSFLPATPSSCPRSGVKASSWRRIQTDDSLAVSALTRVIHCYIWTPRSNISEQSLGRRTDLNLSWRQVRGFLARVLSNGLDSAHYPGCRGNQISQSKLDNWLHYSSGRFGGEATLVAVFKVTCVGVTTTLIRTLTVSFCASVVARGKLNYSRYFVRTVL